MNTLDLLKDKNIPYSLSGRNVGTGWIGVCCPFCGDTSFHGGFPLTGQRIYTCFKCGSHKYGTALKELLGLNYNEINELIEEYDDNPLVKSYAKQAQATHITVPGVRPLNDMARSYLRKRNFPPDFYELKYNLHSTGITGLWKYRIIIPFYEKGQIVSYTGRDYTNKQDIRYKTLAVEQSVVNPKHVLFNENHVTGDHIMVVEGPFDAMRLGDNAVATLGTQVSEEQIRKLSKYSKVFILFDPDAQDKALTLAERVSILGSKVLVVDTEMGHDPGDMTIEEVEQVRTTLGF